MAGKSSGKETSCQMGPAHLPLFTASQMRQADALAIKGLGIPGIVLMERAGMGVAEFLLEHFCTHHCFVVLVGKGNNGGDGFVAARHLLLSGASVQVLTVANPGEYRGEALVNLKILKQLGVAVRHAPTAAQVKKALDSDCVIVDAIFGTGFTGKPRGRAAQFIRVANAAAAQGNPVVAIDIASGVDASTGEVAAEALSADATVTFHVPKVGHFVEPGGYFCGDLILADIGIPEGAGPAPDHFLTDAEEAGLQISPKLEHDNKFSAGVVLVAGGSTGMTGAACLAAESALRAGAGVVTAAIPASLNPIFEQKLLEVMTMPAADTGDGHLSDKSLGQLVAAAAKADCLALGPGIGRLHETEMLVEKLLAACAAPVVLDADGLNAMAGKLARVKRRSAPTVLTPHVGELGRLLGVPAAEASARRLHWARQAAKKSGAIVVLKGSATIVTDGSKTVINPTGNPGLATAGAGDVLTGIIAALIARGTDPFDAAVSGAWLHGAVADMAAEELFQDNLIASDLINYLPLALAGLLEDGESVHEGHESCS